MSYFLPPYPVGNADGFLLDARTPNFAQLRFPSSSGFDDVETFVAERRQSSGLENQLVGRIRLDGGGWDDGQQLDDQFATFKGPKPLMGSRRWEAVFY